MIVTCLECRARFRLSSQRLNGNRVYLRCSACGARFTVELGQGMNSAQPLAIPASHSVSLGRPIVLLIIRSSPLQQIAIKATDQLNVHTVVVSSGEAALRVLSQLTPHAIVVGSELEDIFSFELIDLIRALPRLAATRVLLLSERVVTPRLVRDPSLSFEADRLVDSTVEPAEFARAISEELQRTDHDSRAAPKPRAFHARSVGAV